MSNCSVSDCDRPVLARNLCSSHYARAKRGVPLDTPLGTKTPGGKPCEIDGCRKRAASRGLCTTHRARREAGKDIDAPVAIKLVTNDLLERLRFYAPAGAPDECWEWTAALNKGYGAMAVQGSRMRQAHVVAWELHHKQPLPAGRMIRHSCDNPPCTNPAHLLIGTHADNMQDKIDRQRWAQSISKYRHRTPEEVQAIQIAAAAGVSLGQLARQYRCSRATVGRIVNGEQFQDGGRRKSGAAKVTADDVRQIRKLHSEGERQTQLAERFGIDQTCISAIVRRKTWAHID